MDFPQGGFIFFPMVWGALWAFVWLYVAWRFLKVLERGVEAHERLADAVKRIPPVLSGMTVPEPPR